VEFNAKKLKELRKSKCLTWKKLAELTGVYWTAIAAWERGERMRRADKLMRLAEALGVEVKELFE